MAVRLALIQLPQLLAEVIASVFSTDDHVVVEQLADELGDLRHSGSQRRHDVLIVGVDDPWDGELRAQIARIDAVVLAIRPDGRLMWMYEMQPCPKVLGAVDTAQLRRVVLDSASLGMR
jgi:xanthine/CO dehydrogenase XdhC/CoxF family maturation factor